VGVAEEGDLEVAPAVGHAAGGFDLADEVLLGELVGDAEVLVPLGEEVVEEAFLELAAEHPFVVGVEPSVA